MGLKTSVYLSDDLLKRWRASSLSLSELIRRSLDALDGAEAPHSLEDIRLVVREELAGPSRRGVPRIGRLRSWRL